MTENSGNSLLRFQLGYSLIINMLSVGVSFFTQIFIVRYFGLENFGAFSYWRNNIQLGGQLSLFGFQTASIRFLPDLLQPQNQTALRTFLRQSYFTVSGLALTAGIIIALLFPGKIAGNNVILITATIFTCLSLSLLILLCAQLRVAGSLRQAIFLDRMGHQGLFAIAVFAFFILGAQVTAFELAVTFALAVIVTLSITTVVTQRSFSGHDIKKTSLKQQSQPVSMLKPLLGFFMLSSAGTINARIPLLVVGVLLSTVETGQFAFMTAIAGIVVLPLFSFNQVIGPKLSALHLNQQHKQIGVLIKKVQLISLTVGLVLATIIYFSLPLIEWVTGSPNAVVSGVLLTLLASSVVNAGFGPVATGLAMIDKEQSAALYMNLTVVLKLVLLVSLTWLYGLPGTAAAELISTLVWNLAMEFKLLSTLSERKKLH